ncbi:MAG: FAD-dependent oxidoreductase [Bacteroidota bacterium]
MVRLLLKILVSLLFFITIFAGCKTKQDHDNYQADVVIVGGGTSGVTAAIQAARMGADVLLIEESEWLGGMLTAAGVSATDGNHQMPSGLWGEFRQKLYDHYGGPEEVFTGWVSNTLFEPHVGNRIFREMVESEDNLTVMHGYRLESASVTNDRVVSAEFSNPAKDHLRVNGKVFIDGTEYGDLLAMAGTDYSLYMETYDETMEQGAPEEEHPYVQDMTYVAILKDYGNDEDQTIPEPPNYDPSEFDCMCREVCDESNEELLSCEEVLDYGRLPNDKFMINWPNKGNDYFANNVDVSYEERAQINEDAKDMTRRWIYFMQTEGGFTNLGYADDEFPTEDLFPQKPYIRESRRVVGVDRLYLYDITDPYEYEERTLYKTGIAVADYPVDHHRKKNPEPKQIEFPAVPSYNIPYGSLVPAELDGLVAAEKNISVTNVVNGTTRLQPAVMQIGQAAGAAAAMSVQESIDIRDVDVRELQKHLLDAGMWLMPYMDTDPDSVFFKPIQRVGLSGVMRGEGIPVAWANETRFYPDSTISRDGMDRILERLDSDIVVQKGSSSGEGDITRVQAAELIAAAAGMDVSASGESPFNDADQDVVTFFYEQGWLDGWVTKDEFRPDQPMTRGELAFLIDASLDPFSADTVKIGFSNPMLE